MNSRFTLDWTGFRSPKETACFGLLVLILFATQFPFWSNRIDLDYDSSSLVSTMVKLTSHQNGYHVNRLPGSPTFELLNGFLWKGFVALKIARTSIVVLLRWIIWFFGIWFLSFVFKILRRDLSLAAAFWATLTVALHPLFLWHSWAFAEDIFALSLAFTGWRVLRYHDQRDLAAVLIAVGSAAKAFGVGYAAACIVYLLLIDGFGAAMRFGLLFGSLFLILYLPALADFGMDYKLLTNIPHYGTSPGERPAIGWLLARDALQFYIPILIFMVVIYAKKFYRRQISWESPADIWLACLLPFCFMDFYKFGYRYIFLVVSAIFVVRLVMQGSRGNSADILTYVTMVVFTFIITMKSPYSRSYFLFTLAPIVILISYRCKSTMFWALTCLLTFLPMLYYFQFRGKPPFLAIYPEGFYAAHIDQRPNDYNDFGIEHNFKPLFQIPRS